jgi:hypothetical protein
MFDGSSSVTCNEEFSTFIKDGETDNRNTDERLSRARGLDHLILLHLGVGS